jgi:hypothetical protein
MSARHANGNLRYPMIATRRQRWCGRHHIRPHEALGFYRPIEVHRDPLLKPNPRSQIPTPLAEES